MGKTNKTAVNKFGNRYIATAAMYRGGTPFTSSRNENPSLILENENDEDWSK